MEFGSLTLSLPMVILTVLALLILWLIISWLLRLAWKIISCGCVTILIIALLLIAVHFLGK